MDVFYFDDDRQAYIDFLAEQSERFGAECLAWRLMTNHVNLTAVHDQNESPALGVGEAQAVSSSYPVSVAWCRPYLA